MCRSVQSVGRDERLNPGQMVIKIVNEELIRLMGSETTEIQLQPTGDHCYYDGRSSAGKTTTTAKMAGKLKLKGKNHFLLRVMYIVRQRLKQLQKR